jgi:hypothetical protein
VRPNEYVSFRLLVPIKIEGVIAIEKDARTGRILEAKRGGCGGKAGKLSWIMIDGVAVDLSRVPVGLAMTFRMAVTGSARSVMAGPDRSRCNRPI